MAFGPFRTLHLRRSKLKISCAPRQFCHTTPFESNATPPEPIVKLVKPEYPADAKAAGLEGTVVVRYVVTEQGDVTDVRALKGPPELFSVCVAAVKAMRFKPALDGDGKPLMVVRYMKFPFRLKT